MIRILLMLCLLFAGCTTVEMKSSSKFVKLNTKVYTLDNGIKLVVTENHRLPIFSYYTLFDVGSRNEVEGVTGSTHFLEHMLFKGSKNYPEKYFQNFISEVGGHSNAYTSYDKTVYYESLPSNKLSELVKIEADRLTNLTLDQDAYDLEKKVIFEERKMRLESKDSSKFYFKAMKIAFKGTPYESPVIGSIEDLKKNTKEDLRKFFDTYYVPNNMVISVAGDVDADEVYKMVKRNYSHLKPNQELVKIDARKPYKLRDKMPKEYHMYGEYGLPQFRYIFKFEKTIYDKESYAMVLLTSIIGSGDSGYLKNRLVMNKKSPLNWVYVSSMSLQKAAMIDVSGSIRNPKKRRSTKNLMIKELRNSCHNGITERSLQKAKNGLMKSLFGLFKTNSSVASTLGEAALLGDSPEQIDQDIEIYNSLTVDYIKQVCLDTFKKENGTYMTMWNKNKK